MNKEVHMGFPGGSVAKNPPENAGDAGSTPGSGRSPGERDGNPIQYSCLGNPIDRRSLVGYSSYGCKIVRLNNNNKKAHILKNSTVLL